MQVDGVKRDELAEAHAKVAELTMERDYLRAQVSQLQAALDARGRECESAKRECQIASEQLAKAVASNNIMVMRMEQQQQLWRDRTDEVLLRAAVDLNRQVGNSSCANTEAIPRLVVQQPHEQGAPCKRAETSLPRRTSR